MKYVSEHYQGTLEVLADQLVTPERFSGAVVVATIVETPAENLQGLWD